MPETIQNFNTRDAIILKGIAGKDAFSDFNIQRTDGGFTVAFGADSLTIMTSLRALEAEHFEFI